MNQPFKSKIAIKPLVALCLVFFIASSAAASDFTNAACPMRPPPLDIATIKAAKDVKSMVVDSNKLIANILLKDGSSARIINMGCQHAGSVARAWLMHPPSLRDSGAWVEEANKLARIAFTPPQAKSFAAWAEGHPFQQSDDNRLVMQGTGYGDIAYAIEIEMAGMGMGPMLTISYSYP